MVKMCVNGRKFQVIHFVFWQMFTGASLRPFTSISPKTAPEFRTITNNSFVFFFISVPLFLSLIFLSLFFFSRCGSIFSSQNLFFFFCFSLYSYSAFLFISLTRIFILTFFFLQFFCLFTPTSLFPFSLSLSLCFYIFFSLILYVILFSEQ